MRISKPVWLFFAGLMFSVVMVPVGVELSGGGHFNLLTIPIIWPNGFGLLLWPCLGYLCARLTSASRRILFVVLLLGNYVGSARAEVQEFGGSTEAYLDEHIFRPYPAGYYLTAIVTVFIYAALQYFLWREFARSLHAKR